MVIALGILLFVLVGVDDQKTAESDLFAYGTFSVPLPKHYLNSYMKYA